MKRLIYVVALGAAASCLLTGMSSAAVPGVGAPEVIVDFSNNDQGDFDPLSYRSDGIVFPPQRCGNAGCAPWFVGFIQGDNALVGNPLLGGITAMFTRPVSELSLQVAPAAQGTATYTLTAFGASGKELASQSLTVTQDIGDPTTGPPGYFTIGVGGFAVPATSFALTSVFVRSSFGINLIEYGASSIHYTHWGEQPS